MSLEIIKKYYDAFNHKDINAILALCTEDVINDPNQGDSQAGKDKLKAFLETAWAHFDETVSDLVLMANADQSKIASEYLVRGIYYQTKPGLFPSTNQKYEIYPVTVFTVKNGKIARMTRYYNTKKWLDMVNPNRDA
jgi:steroid delta-isomerase-like uncharacterized protein